jgi:hypothetical protein
MAPQVFKKGDLVRYFFDKGRSYEWLYGTVVKAGPKTFTVKWESGQRNRLPQDTHLVEAGEAPKEG